MYTPFLPAPLAGEQSSVEGRYRVSISLQPLARAVVLVDGQLLLANHLSHDNTFLPGGHVDPLESCVATIEREIAEELGLEALVGEYLGAIEHRWCDDEDERVHHEINHYFIVSIAGIASGNSPPSMEDHLRFFWSPLDDLERHNLLPAPLRDLVRSYAAGDRTTWWGSTL